MTGPVTPRHDVQWTPAKIGAFWDFVSSVAAQAEQYFTHTAGPSVAHHAASLVPLADKDVLDFGCGPGHLFPHLARAAPTMRYVGMDFSPGSIAELEQRWRGRPQFAGGAVLEFPVKAERQFDAIVCCEVVEHLDDATLEQVCDAFARLLRKGGRLYLTTPNAEVLDRNKVMCPDCGAVFHRWQHQRSWDARTLVAQLAKHGFVEPRTFELVYAPSWARARAVTLLRKARGLPLPNLCYVGTKA
ncbi:MAG TPA: class I SAM-dependent methyltransferase [Kofleriaceae bacterium]|nr:class I SAM-dependent methyltransferase [Kofleriaceae bacterium]